MNLSTSVYSNLNGRRNQSRSIIFMVQEPFVPTLIRQQTQQVITLQNVNGIRKTLKWSGELVETQTQVYLIIFSKGLPLECLITHFAPDMGFRVVRTYITNYIVSSFGCLIRDAKISGPNMEINSQLETYLIYWG